jgi:hypothetical protein
MKLCSTDGMNTESILLNNGMIKKVVQLDQFPILVKL